MQFFAQAISNYIPHDMTSVHLTLCLLGLFTLIVGGGMMIVMAAVNRIKQTIRGIRKERQYPQTFEARFLQ